MNYPLQIETCFVRFVLFMGFLISVGFGTPNLQLVNQKRCPLSPIYLQLQSFIDQIRHFDRYIKTLSYIHLLLHSVAFVYITQYFGLLVSYHIVVLIAAFTSTTEKLNSSAPSLFVFRKRHRKHTKRSLDETWNL